MATLRIRIGSDNNKQKKGKLEEEGGWIHTIQNRDLVAMRSQYFEQLQGWQLSDHHQNYDNDHPNHLENPILELDPPIPESDVPPVAVIAFLQALEEERTNNFDIAGFSKTMSSTLSSQSNNKIFKKKNDLNKRQHYYFYRLWHYFGCQQQVLNEYIVDLSAKERLELLEACVGSSGTINSDDDEEEDYTNDNKEIKIPDQASLQKRTSSCSPSSLAVALVDGLLTLPQFFEKASKLSVPLDRPYCVSVAAASALLRARVETAPKPDLSPANWAGWAWHQSIKTVLGAGREPDWMDRLSPESFALLTLTKFAPPPAPPLLLLQPPMGVGQQEREKEEETVTNNNGKSDFETATAMGWTPNTLALVFSYLPQRLPAFETASVNGGNNNNHVIPKPKGSVETLVVMALYHGMAIPDLIKGCYPCWDLNLSQIALALYRVNRIHEVLTFSHPLIMIQAISDSVWSNSPQSCAQALLENQGGVSQLVQDFDRQCDKDKDDGRERCRWLAQLPVLIQARHVLAQCQTQQEQQQQPQQNLQNNLQSLPPVVASLFRCLFLHVDFDPSIPPEWLGTLSLGRDFIGKRAIEQAILYLETGIDSPVFVQLPWRKYLNAPSLERVIRALQKIEQTAAATPPTSSSSPPRFLSALWHTIDLTMVPNSLLDGIPAKVLATHAVFQGRGTNATVVALMERVEQLEKRCQQLELDCREQERRQKQQEQRQQQQERRFRQEQLKNAKMETIR
ncbi:hypothetical protein ACA910_022716 [Epithemia clementina (nom. ined.)]